MNCRYGHTWAEESRNHIAGISPVTTTVSGLPWKLPKVTVVSRVLGRQLENSHASSGSRSFAEVASMAASTALLRNLRAAGAGRRDGWPEFAASTAEGNMAEPAPIAIPRRTARRD